MMAFTFGYNQVLMVYLIKGNECDYFFCFELPKRFFNIGVLRYYGVLQI